MGKRLVIAEKPSVGASIAAVLGLKDRKDGYIEGQDYIVSWGFGHLAELANADTYDEKYAKWNYNDLPIVPANWKYKVPKDKYNQFATLKHLMHREDVSAVINACDAGREGELIFRNIYNQAGCKKPIYRLWISSMEDSAIRQGFAELKSGKEFDNLYAAARCREWADWLVGINATRLFSVLYHRTLNVGRVVSPTLAILVQREAEIDAFKPEPFYTAELNFGSFTATSEKFEKKADAKAVISYNGTAVVKSVVSKEKSEKAPGLYDLTTLQREANRQHGYTAQQTLDYVQSLYEKKLCTYPRTDSRYLTDDMASGVSTTVNIPERTIVTKDYTGSLDDIHKIETTSARLYSYAQSKGLSPVFPAGLIISWANGSIKVKAFLEVMDKTATDPLISVLSGGKFLCRKIDMAENCNVLQEIENTYGKNNCGEIILANILLDKFQIGTKKSELQKAMN